MYNYITGKYTRMLLDPHIKGYMYIHPGIQID